MRWNEVLGVSPSSINPDNTTLVNGTNDAPTPDGNNHVGVFTFYNLPLGAEYVLALSRVGCLSRYAKVTVTENGLLGHRFLIPGDVNGNGNIDSQDVSLFNVGKYRMEEEDYYQPRCDFNADGDIEDFFDRSILNRFMNSIVNIYKDTNDWLDGK